MENVTEMEQYQLANTTLDSAINLFLLEKEGQTPDNNGYLERQSNRVTTSLAALNSMKFAMGQPFNTPTIRVACLLDWGLYRQRFSLDGLDNLQFILQQLRDWQIFADTAPPSA